MKLKTYLARTAVMIAAGVASTIVLLLVPLLYLAKWYIERQAKNQEKAWREHMNKSTLAFYREYNLPVSDSLERHLDFSGWKKKQSKTVDRSTKTTVIDKPVKNTKKHLRRVA